MVPRMSKVAIEYLLLIGRQHAANLAEALPEQLMPLVVIIPAGLHHFEARIAQDVADLIALRRCQIEFEIHSLDQARSWNVQVMIAVGHRAEREANQKTRDSNYQAEPNVRLSWQDRSRSVASPAPMDRLSLLKSCSIRAPIARH